MSIRLPHLPLKHGFNIANILTLIVLILILWGIRFGIRVTPEIRSTADKVASLNDLKNVDIKVGDCIPIRGQL